jgi:predicted esterase
MRSDANLKTPMFQAHGDSDPVVDFKFGQLTHEKLKSLGIDAEFHAYGKMGHEAQPEEMDDLGKWLKARIPNEPSVNGSDPLKGEGKGKV